MKYQFPALIALLALMANACAQSDVYLCIGENGSKEYKNTGAVKGCKKVDVPGLTLIPAPPRHAAPVQTASLHSSSAPADFPRVEPSAQKGRDNERRQILLDELKKEQDQLALLKKDYNNGEPERQADERNFSKYQERIATMKEDINRAEKNIEALQRELKRDGGDLK